MPRRLDAEERALWNKVVESVRPLSPSSPAAEAQDDPQPASPAAAARPRLLRRPPAEPRKVSPGTTLDGTWDRRIGRGNIQPEMTVDLHGHNLATAYDLLDRRLEEAVRAGIRVMLLITGKPPRGEPPTARGRIRAAVGDWLHASRHAGAIAAVRNAHPRHGGDGALYIVLRRNR